MLFDGDGFIMVLALDFIEDFSVFCDAPAQIVLIKSLRRTEPLCPGMDLAVGELGMDFVLDLRIGC
jgi:hypothetical protein